MIRIVSDHITSPAGYGTAENLNAVWQKKSAIRLIDNRNFWPEPFYASAWTTEQIDLIRRRADVSLTLLEMLMADAIEQVCQKAEIDLKSDNTHLIVATTKGNIDLLSDEIHAPDRSLLFQAALSLQQYFGAVRRVQVVSTACTSGLTAIINGARMIEAGSAKHVVVCGGDLLTQFVLSGFQSFKAVSHEPCKPYDDHRSGITLGEGVAALAITKSDDNGLPYFISGATANDANHISGPSRTGEGLYQCVSRTLKRSAKKPDMISAHGTATAYNDEMEAQAFNRAALQDVPLHSLKGIYGHTLGAAGLIETIIALKALMQQRLIPSVGYHTHGVTLPLNVTTESTPVNMKTILKTSSGFGGSNAAALFGI